MSHLQTAAFCPTCGSPDVTQNPLGPSVCNSCDWKGAAEELLATTFRTEMSPDAAVVQFSRDLRGVFAPFAPSVLRLLLKWGFLKDADPTVLGRYMTEMARAMAKSAIDVRAEILREGAKKDGKSAG